jgi:hypothetical protein
MPDPKHPSLPTSQLAWAALICGLVFCVPLLGLIAILLGGLALGRIAASNGTLGGRRLALLAMGFGAASTVIWALGLDQFQSWYLGELNERMEAAVVDVLDASAQDEAANVRAVFANAGAELSDEQVGAFAAAIDSEWGELLSVSVLRSTPQGGPLTPRMAVAFDAEYARLTVSGVASFALHNTIGSMLHEPKLREIELVLPDGTTARLGSGYDDASKEELGATP